MGCSFGFSFGSGNNHSMTTSVSNGPNNCILMHVNKDTYNNIWTSTADANKSAFLHQLSTNQTTSCPNLKQVQTPAYQKSSPTHHYHFNQERCGSTTSLFILKDLKVGKTQPVHCQSLVYVQLSGLMLIFAGAIGKVSADRMGVEDINFNPIIICVEGDTILKAQFSYTDRSITEW